MSPNTPFFISPAYCTPPREVCCQVGHRARQIPGKAGWFTSTVLHLGAEDDHLVVLQVHIHRGGGGHTLGERVGRELSCIEDVEVGA